MDLVADIGPVAGQSGRSVIEVRPDDGDGGNLRAVRVVLQKPGQLGRSPERVDANHKLGLAEEREQQEGQSEPGHAVRYGDNMGSELRDLASSAGPS